MTKTIEVQNCPTCPYKNTKNDQAAMLLHYYCGVKNRRIDDSQIMSIPKWCPLPDTEVKDG